MKKLFFTTVLLLAAISLASCSEASFDESKGQIVVGLECAYAPFNWLETSQTPTNVKINNANGYAQGYDVQMARLIADELGYELVIKMIDWDSLINSLKSGMIDVIIAGMSPTEKRKQSISFTDEYYRSTHVLLLKNNSPYVNAKKFSDLNNARVMGQVETVYDKLALQLSEVNTTIKYNKPLASVPEIVNAINSGIVDFTIVEEPVAKSIVQSDSSYTYIVLDDAFDVEEHEEIVSIGVRNNDTALLEKLNAALAKISQAKRIQLMDDAVLKNYD